MPRDSLSYQQARAEIARTIMREYTWRDSLFLLWRLPGRHQQYADIQRSSVSIAYSIAWFLLPGGPDGAVQ